MGDKWKAISGYEGLYEVSEDGEIKSLARMKRYRDGARKHPERIMRSRLVNGGYAQVMLTNAKGARRFLLVHRLVAEAFVPNPNQLPQVNHKDGNKLNNCAENLEWCTAKNNMIHSVKTGLRSDAKQVDVFSKCGTYIGSYPSAKSAAEAFGVAHQNVSACCRGEVPSAGGYIWRYQERGEHQ